MKKGKILNQLAIISDLLDEMNLETISKTVIIDLNEISFNNLHAIIREKSNVKNDTASDNFSIQIGFVNFIFNKNSA